MSFPLPFPHHLAVAGRHPFLPQPRRTSQPVTPTGLFPDKLRVSRITYIRGSLSIVSAGRFPLLSKSLNKPTNQETKSLPPSCLPTSSRTIWPPEGTHRFIKIVCYSPCASPLFGPLQSACHLPRAPEGPGPRDRCRIYYTQESQFFPLSSGSISTAQRTLQSSQTPGSSPWLPDPTWYFLALIPPWPACLLSSLGSSFHLLLTFHFS